MALSYITSDSTGAGLSPTSPLTQVTAPVQGDVLVVVCYGTYGSAVGYWTGVSHNDCDTFIEVVNVRSGSGKHVLQIWAASVTAQSGSKSLNWTVTGSFSTKSIQCYEFRGTKSISLANLDATPVTGTATNTHPVGQDIDTASVNDLLIAVAAYPYGVKPSAVPGELTALISNGGSGSWISTGYIGGTGAAGTKTLSDWTIGASREWLAATVVFMAVPELSFAAATVAADATLPKSPRHSLAAATAAWAGTIGRGFVYSKIVSAATAALSATVHKLSSVHFSAASVAFSAMAYKLSAMLSFSAVSEVWSAALVSAGRFARTFSAATVAGDATVSSMSSFRRTFEAATSLLSAALAAVNAHATTVYEVSIAAVSNAFSAALTKLSTSTFVAATAEWTAAVRKLLYETFTAVSTEPSATLTKGVGHRIVAAIASPVAGIRKDIATSFSSDLSLAAQLTRVVGKGVSAATVAWSAVVDFITRHTFFVSIEAGVPLMEASIGKRIGKQLRAYFDYASQFATAFQRQMLSKPSKLRTFSVPFEVRTYVCDLESRTFVVEKESRADSASSDPRTFTPPNESKEFES